MSKTIIITGASDGIGKAITLELAKSKHNLILIGRDTEKLKEVEQKAKSLGANSIEIFQTDLTQSDQITMFSSKIAETYPAIDGIINNAGIWQKKAQLDSIPEQEISSVISTNLTGLITITQKILPLIRKSSNGFIINISSRSGYAAQQGQSIYAATKYGVRGFTEVLREDLLETGIRVSGIYQGGTNTQMFNKAGESFPEEKLATFIPTEELAKVICFLIERPKGIWLPEIRIENK